MSVYEMIAKQQGPEGTDYWMVGEQLKDMCREDPRCEELLEKDLEQEKMGLKEAAKKIKEWADKHRKGSYAVVTPIQADRILREFYGLPTQCGRQEQMAADKGRSASRVRLEDFL